MLGVSKNNRGVCGNQLLTNYCLLPFWIWITLFLVRECMHSIASGGWWRAMSSHPAGTQSTKGCNSPWIRSQPPNQPSPTPAAPLLPSLTAGRGPSPDSPVQSQSPGLPRTLRYVSCSFTNSFFVCDLVWSHRGRSIRTVWDELPAFNKFKTSINLESFLKLFSFSFFFSLK